MRGRGSGIRRINMRVRYVVHEFNNDELYASFEDVIKQHKIPVGSWTVLDSSLKLPRVQSRAGDIHLYPIWGKKVS